MYWKALENIVAGRGRMGVLLPDAMMQVAHAVHMEIALEQSSSVLS